MEEIVSLRPSNRRDILPFADPFSSPSFLCQDCIQDAKRGREAVLERGRRTQDTIAGNTSD